MVALWKGYSQENKTVDGIEALILDNNLLQKRLVVENEGPSVYGFDFRVVVLRWWG